jgi:hypothetical protein
MFTTQNTEGFTQEILNKMNAELEAAIAELDQDALNYEDQVKAESDKIFNKYC